MTGEGREVAQPRAWANDTSRFATRTAWVFVTNLTQLFLGAVSLFLIARLLGPESFGQYALALAWLGFIFALGQLGMPAAMTFFAGRGRSIGSLRSIALRMTAIASAVLIALAVLAIPLLQGSLLRAAPPAVLALVLVALPCLFLIQSTAGIMYARGANLEYNRIAVGQGALMLLLTVVLVAVLGAGVAGALGAYLASNWIATLACVWEVHRLARRRDGESGETLTMREFTAYAIRLYPQNVTSFFSYRADVFLLSWLLPNPAGPVGLYSLAVRLAEITFYVPNSISAMLYPAISASDRGEADRLAPMVGRLTMLVTLVAAVAITFGAVIAMWVVLPAYKDAFPALLVLMPGILSLSLSKILASYLSGLGKPLPTAVAASVSLGANLALNVILIPRLGIIGASVASLLSYTLQTAILLRVSSRWAGIPAGAFVMPGRPELDRVRAMVARAASSVPRLGRGVRPAATDLPRGEPPTSAGRS